MVSGYVPDRADIVRLDFDPQAGREHAKTRHALVLSPRGYNRVSRSMLACPITSVLKGTLFDVPLPSHLKTRGFVLADQVRSMDWHVRRARRIEAAPHELCRAVADRVLALLLD